MNSSWGAKIVAGLSRHRGGLVTAGVYLFGARAFTSRFYLEQGRCAGERNDPRGCATLSFDVDYPEDAAALEEVCESLDRMKIRASFAVVGKWVEKYPTAHRRLVSAGHEILNHTLSHPDHPTLEPGRNFDSLSPTEQKAQIETCHKICQDILGVSPQGFRAPHFGNVRERAFYDSLAGLGYLFSSSVIGPESPLFGLPVRTPSGVWEFPVSCCPVHPFTVLDTWHALRKNKPRHSGPLELAGLVAEVCSLAADNGGYLNLYFDPRDVAQFQEARRALEALKPGPHRPRWISFREHLDLLEKNS